jgi:hypothetical protein
MISTILRNEALLMLEGKGTILDVARRISRAIKARSIDAAVIGGISVVLHQYVRTTMDVDLWVPGSLSDVGECLEAEGATFNSAKREFLIGNIPVHLVTLDQTGFAPTHLVDIEEIRTVSLADLISLKLSSGIGNIRRTRDISDVIGLIEANHLTSRFTPKIAKAFRKDFKELLKRLG